MGIKSNKNKIILIYQELFIELFETNLLRSLVDKSSAVDLSMNLKSPSVCVINKGAVVMATSGVVGKN